MIYAAPPGRAFYAIRVPGDPDADGDVAAVLIGPAGVDLAALESEWWAARPPQAIDGPHVRAQSFERWLCDGGRGFDRVPTAEHLMADPDDDDAEDQ